MNPEYDNRTYYIQAPGKVRLLFSDLISSGNLVANTREFANIRLVFPMLERDKDWWKALGANVNEVEHLMVAIENEDRFYFSEIYHARHYCFLKDAIEEAKAHFVTDGGQTRRAVINFPSIHCFESIQCLLRGFECIITVNMRSCNAYKNLMNDAYLAYLVSRKILSWVSAVGCSMIMNIGSLHLFKEDINNVL